ncbi:MAG: cation-transporting P-type ATPase [Desulfomonilaceae bacterium]
MDYWHSISIDEVLAKLGTSREGLTQAEVSNRLEKSGRNEILRHKPPSPLKLLFKQFANFFVLVLAFAAGLAYAVSFMPGESDRFVTALFIFGIIVITVALGFFEEYRAEKELEALDRLLQFKTTVKREGLSHTVNADEVVPGDIVLLAHGQKVAADARLLEAYDLRVDESALTGESLAVDKSLDEVKPDAPLAERTNMVFGSTHITHGTGVAVVVSTGMATEVGQIATALEQIGERPTPFEIEVQVMARQMTIIVGFLAIILAFILYFWLRESVVDVVLNTLSLAVATIPESLPIVLIFALALGAHEMAGRRAVIRRLAVVESLGSVDTVCTDKTGTLTQNMMTVEQLFAAGRTTEVSHVNELGPVTSELFLAGVLCNEGTIDATTSKVVGDAVDTALLIAAQKAGLDIQHEREHHPKVNEIAFSSERKMMTTIHLTDGHFVAYAKGAAEVILARCDTFLQDGRVGHLDETTLKTIRGQLEKMESEAMYVIALAKKELPWKEIDSTTEEQLTLLGFEAMRDPPHPEAADAIAAAQGAGIRVVMITGDNRLTAQAIGRKLGIGDRSIEAREAEEMSSEELTEKMRSTDILARATPQSKQQVLKSLQKAGHFVAMTGDGVNDAPALRQSDVGVAMGLRGTDIAKETADIVLLDDNFGTIVAAIEEGRRIFDNIRKFTNYLLSTSLGAVFVVLVLSLSGYFPLSAKMLLWINVVTSLIPAAALAADPAVPALMKRRPRRHDEPILNKAIYLTIAGSVFRTLIAYVFIFWVGLYLGGVTYARSMLFTSIVLHAFARIVVVRELDELSIWSNRPLLWSYLAAIGLQLVALYTPACQLFDVVPLDWRAWAVQIPVVSLSSLTGIYMTRWILKLVPLWEK